MKRTAPITALLATTSVLLSVGTAPALAATTPYVATPGPFRAAPQFSVRYTGTSHTETTYRATPPNPGGKPDHNRAHDKSTATWTLTASTTVAIPACTGTAPDPCSAVTGTTTASGKTAMTGRIDHTHVDGLYRQLDSEAHCSVTSHGVPRTGLSAKIGVTYDPAQNAFVVQALNPIVDALTLTPTTCPGIPDGIDRILDNYFTPGFSLAGGDGPGRWFTSAAVAIPADVWHTSSRIRLRPALTAAGRPPAKCGGAKVTFTQVCRTGGSWAGVLTFTAVN